MFYQVPKAVYSTENHVLFLEYLFFGERRGREERREGEREKRERGEGEERRGEEGEREEERKRRERRESRERGERKFAENYWIKNLLLSHRYVKQRLNFTSLEDWYKIRESDIVDLGGKFLLAKYHSAPNLVMEVFKNHTWDAFRFSSSVSKPKPVTFEDQRALLLYPKKEVRKCFFLLSLTFALFWFSFFLSLLWRKIGNILGYTKPADYYNLSQPLLQANGGYYLLEEYKKGVREIVTALFPEHAWEPWKFNSSNWWESGEIREKYMQYPL